MPRSAPRSGDGLERSKDEVPANLNSVRGLACLLVVTLHVIGGDSSEGLHLPMTSGWHYAMESIAFIRMPLFTALSGYLYAGRRVTGPAFGRFWAKKLRRLGVPLIFVTIVVWSLQISTPVSLMKALLFNFEHLWYIQALIVLFLTISIWDSFFRPNCAALVLAGLVAIMGSQLGLTATGLFSINGAIYLAPYFLFGIVLRENPAWLRDRSIGWLALGVVVIVLACQQLGLNGLVGQITVLQLPAALAGMAGAVFLLQRFPRNRLLAAIGGISYTIYLWHPVPVAAVTAILLKAGIGNVPALVSVNFVAAVTVPIVLYYVARSVPFLCVAVTGEAADRGNEAVPLLRWWRGLRGLAALRTP